MRELKFRVWSNTFVKFLTKEEWFFDFDGDLYFWDIVENDMIRVPENEYIIQQYTGLKDKNGVEIYEGDIVKATSDQYENENFVGKVIFDEGCFLTWVHKNDIRGIWGEDDIEVVGNIFENSELLEK